MFIKNKEKLHLFLNILFSSLKYIRQNFIHILILCQKYHKNVSLKLMPSFVQFVVVDLFLPFMFP